MPRRGGRVLGPRSCGQHGKNEPLALTITLRALTIVDMLAAKWTILVEGHVDSGDHLALDHVRTADPNSSSSRCLALIAILGILFHQRLPH